MRELIDLTKLELGSIHRGRQIEACPKCGKPGFITRYRSGSTCTHTEWDLGWTIRTAKQCTIPNP